MEEEQIQILKFSFNNLYLPATYFQNCINKTVYIPLLNTLAYLEKKSGYSKEVQFVLFIQFSK